MTGLCLPVIPLSPVVADFAKSRNRRYSFVLLATLSGRQHRVYGGIALMTVDRDVVGWCVVRLNFAD